MTKYVGAINLTSAYKQNASLPIDDRFVFSTIADRDALDELRRFDGLFAYVEADRQNYQLQGGTDNSNWVLSSSGQDFIPGVKVLSGENIDVANITDGSDIDGYTLSVDDRVVLQRQADSIDNGVYKLYSDNFRRDDDYTTADSLNEKKFIPENGTYNKRLFFIENSIINVGTDDIIIKELDYVKTDDFSVLITNINENSAKFNYKDVDFEAYETNNSQYTKNDINNRISDFQNILGWDKTANSTLYFKGLNDGSISISYSDADRDLVNLSGGSGAVSIIINGTGIRKIYKGVGNITGYINVNTSPNAGEKFEITYTGDSATLSTKSHLVSTREVEHIPQEGSGFAVVIDGQLFPLAKAKPNYIPVDFGINKEQSDMSNQRKYNTYFLSDKIIMGFYSTGGYPGGVHSRDYDGNLNFYISDADFDSATGYTDNRTIKVIADENYIYVVANDISTGNEVRFYQLDHSGNLLKWYKTTKHISSIKTFAIGENQNIYAIEQNMRNNNLFIHRYDFSSNNYYSIQPKNITNMGLSLNQNDTAADFDGKYIELSDASNDYYFWFNVNGESTDPALPGKTGVSVDIISTDNAAMIASKLSYKVITKGIGSLSISNNLYFSYYGPVNSTWTTGDIPFYSTSPNINFYSSSMFFSVSSNRLVLSFKSSLLLVLKPDGTVGNEFDNCSGKVDILYGLGSSLYYGQNKPEVLTARFTDNINVRYDTDDLYWYQRSSDINGTLFMHKFILGGVNTINFLNIYPFVSSDNYNVDSSETMFFMDTGKSIYNVNTGELLYSASEDDYFVRDTYNIYVSLDKNTIYIDGGDKYYTLDINKLPAIYMSGDFGITARPPMSVSIQDLMYIIPAQLGFTLNGVENISFRYLLDQTVPNIGSGSGSGS